VAASTELMTVEQLEQLPESGEFYYELHHGGLVKVCRPKAKHTRIQKRSEVLLERAVAEDFVVIMELPFRALLEYELRAADVAVLTRPRFDQIDPDDFLHGAPEFSN